MFGVGEKQARGGAASLDLTNNRQTFLPVVVEKGIRTKLLLGDQELQAVGASAGNILRYVEARGEVVVVAMGPGSAACSSYPAGFPPDCFAADQ